MSGTMQSIMVVGRVGRDPESRQTETPLATFPVAVDDGYGENKTTQWFNVTCWGKTAEIAATYVRKGRMISILGRMKFRKYTDKAGVERMAHELVCNQLTLVDNRPAEEAPAPTPTVASRVPARKAPSNDDFMFEDSPF